MTCSFLLNLQHTTICPVQADPVRFFHIGHTAPGVLSKIRSRDFVSWKRFDDDRQHPYKTAMTSGRSRTRDMG